MSQDPAIEAVGRALAGARTVCVVTGAGVSAESGIRTFRDTMEGLWKEFDPAKLATPEAFARDPEMVTRWYDWRRQACREAEPNPGHLALAEIERRLKARGARFTLATQNVDRLHHKAGSANVVELHGTIMVWRCVRTGREFEPPLEPFERFPPPSPFAEGSILRPSVVWFGEMLPEQALEAAGQAASTCDVFLSVGTSSLVYPAAGLVQLAMRRGATTVEINRDPTQISEAVDFPLRGRSGEILPRVVERMGS